MGTQERSKWRKWMAVKWGCAVMAVVLVVAWIGSAWCMAGWQQRIDQGGVHAGRFVVVTSRIVLPGPDPVRWKLQRYPHEFYWMPATYMAGTSRVVSVPLWPVVAGAVAGTVAVWIRDGRRRGRVRDGRCERCGYDRAGLVSGAMCPECGAAAVGAR